MLIKTTAQEGALPRQLEVQMLWIWIICMSWKAWYLGWGEGQEQEQVLAAVLYTGQSARGYLCMVSLSLRRFGSR